MTLQTTGRGAEENTTKTSHYRRRGGIQSRENLKQKNGTRKRKVLSKMEGLYGRRRYLGE